MVYTQDHIQKQSMASSVSEISVSLFFVPPSPDI